MVERVVLTEEEGMYVILTYNSLPEPRLKTCFPYTKKPREDALKDAKIWGEHICRENGIYLEEKLEISLN